MNINEAFPSKFLKAADISGSEPTVTIKEVKIEEIGDDTRPVLYFVGKDKGIVLNKTNATNISDAYGFDTDLWTGKKITLFTAWVDFQGRSVEAIRVRPAREGAPAAKAKAAVAPRFESENPASFEDIPF